jgi:hypothetical protein
VNVVGSGLRRSRWFLRALLLCAIGLASATAHVRASVVLALSLEDMTRKADVVALATARESHSRREKNGSLIVTDVTLEVETPLKGGLTKGERIVATVLGGALEGLALQVPGEASFATGQRVVVFLYRAPTSRELRVVGMSQGVLPLFAQDGNTMVAPGGQSAALVEPGVGGDLHDAPDALQKPQPLGDVLTRIRQFANERGAPAPAAGSKSK